MAGSLSWPGWPSSPGGWSPAPHPGEPAQAPPASAEDSPSPSSDEAVVVDLSNKSAEKTTVYRSVQSQDQRQQQSTVSDGGAGNVEGGRSGESDSGQSPSTRSGEAAVTPDSPELPVFGAGSFVAQLKGFRMGMSRPAGTPAGHTQPAGGPATSGTPDSLGLGIGSVVGSDDSGWSPAGSKSPAASLIGYLETSGGESPAATFTALSPQVASGHGVPPSAGPAPSGAATPETSGNDGTVSRARELYQLAGGKLEETMALARQGPSSGAVI